MPERTEQHEAHAASAQVLKALADPVRLQIMDSLAARPRGVTDLARTLPITRQGTAKHLGVLRRAGLVETRPGPTGESYRVIPAPVDEASRVLARAADRWTTQLELLKQAAESAPDGSADPAAEEGDGGMRPAAPGSSP
ncbi:metalloregulator ArsR/SmtB family transcription factor [Brachybacterium halotolerans subsp. kimchii]|uniref:ArsR/SmtB family transcription factor n=1 Tax=Brachybacterium halotolerans TaxID=2795215 RepID=UPI001E35F3B8|nr:metalloregulator ArsR/SmtB family transcription factor [Brachybacterium halotolerans]UEJ81342.1 metalloregulator ArsR/SmtB family transcription factor [Brachybacterium halotolerans subsp. kimchii]